MEIDVAEQVKGGAMVLDVDIGSAACRRGRAHGQGGKARSKPMRSALVHRLICDRGAERRDCRLTREKP